jgi:hypothetical protein
MAGGESRRPELLTNLFAPRGGNAQGAPEFLRVTHDPRVSDSARSEVKDRCGHVAPFPTGGPYTKDLSSMGSAPCHSCDYHTTGIDQFMNLRTQVGKCIAGLLEVVLESLNTDRAVSERSSEAKVGREDLNPPLLSSIDSRGHDESGARLRHLGFRV